MKRKPKPLKRVRKEKPAPCPKRRKRRGKMGRGAEVKKWEAVGTCWGMNDGESDMRKRESLKE